MRPRFVLRYATGAIAGAGLVVAAGFAAHRTAPSTAPPPVAAGHARVGRTLATTHPSPISNRTPSPAARAPSTHPLEVVLRVPWGSAVGELGHRRPREGAPEGPMSFAVDAEGRAYVLDQVNARVQVFEHGNATRVVSLPSDTFQDIALDDHGGMLLLDRLATGSIAFVDASGRVDHEVAIVGPGVPEGGAVTGMFHRPDGTWVEVEHAALVRVATADGRPDPDRPVAFGRFSSDGAATYRAKLAPPDGAIVLAQASSSNGPTELARVRFPMRLAYLTALDADAKGRLLLGAALVEESPTPPFDVVDQAEVVVVLDRDGRETARIDLPPKTTPDEQFRTIRVGADGFVYDLATEDDAAVLRRVSP